jgi:catechol 2,3-dioxygenase-like lactoylglutathione lyase family enzyme
MEKSLRFYRDVLGLKLDYGGEAASFCSFSLDGGHLNLQLSSNAQAEWGRLILYSDDVDQMHALLTSHGYDPPKPEDAPWGERFFHVRDPDGHEISIAQPLRSNSFKQGFTS